MPRISFNQDSIHALEQFIAMEEGKKKGILRLEKNSRGEQVLSVQDSKKLYSSVGGFLKHVRSLCTGGYTLSSVAKFLSQRKVDNTREKRVVEKATKLLQKKIVHHNEKDRFFSIESPYITFYENKIQVHRSIHTAVIEKGVLALSEKIESIESFVELVLLSQKESEWKAVEKVFKKYEEKIALYKEHIILACKEQNRKGRERLYDLLSLDEESRRICSTDQVLLQSSCIQTVCSQVQDGTVNKEELLGRSGRLFIYKELIDFFVKVERTYEEQFFYYLIQGAQTLAQGLLGQIDRGALRETFLLLNAFPQVRTFFNTIESTLSEGDLKALWKEISGERKQGFLEEILGDFISEKTEQPLHQVVTEAKEKERATSWESLQVASKKWIGFLQFEEVFLSGKEIDGAFIVKNKIERVLHKTAKRAGLKEDIYNEYVEEIYNALNGKPLTKEANINLVEIIQELKKSHDVLSSSLFKNNYDALAQQCKDIASFLETPSKDPATRNQHVLGLIRNVLNNPLYESIKELPMHPIASYIQTICIANYTEAFVLDAFRGIGEGLVQKVSLREDMNFSDFLQEVREEGYKNGLIKNEASLGYVYSHFKNALGAVSSHPFLQNFVTYDARTSIENIPGAFYDETLETSFGDISLRSIYTGTPTLNDIVAPEFLAVLQGIENRYFMTKEEKEKSLIPFGLWHYANLQDITSSKENGRSTAIMLLFKAYPYSFYGITITNDSPFFKDGVHGQNEETILSYIRNYTKGPLTEEYRDLFLNELLHDANFSLDKRTEKKGGGYYFPATSDNEKKHWKKVIRYIATECFSHIQKNMRPQSEKDTEGAYHWMQKAAFRELVHLAIIRYSQLEQAKKVRETFFDEEDISMLISAICKECIDRGGKLMTELFWTSSEEINKETILDAVASLYSRSLLSRYRLILFDRLLPLLALFHILDKPDIKNFFSELFSSLHGIQSKGVLSLRR